MDDAALLAAWERAAGMDRPWRELALLQATDPRPLATLARLPIGERDRGLLELRERAFGSRMEAETTCPECGERLELDLDGSELRAVGAGRSDETAISHRGRRVAVRPPDSTDVAACGEDPRDPATILLERCVTEAERPGRALASRLRGLVVRRMADLDPGAELRLDACCPACAARWELTLDPAAYVLLDAERHALQLLAEVDQLARAYGWREADILALPPDRRRRYVELSSS